MKLIAVLALYSFLPIAADTPESRGRGLITLLDKGDFDAAVQTFAEPLLSILPADKLKATWQSIQGQVGKFQSVERVRVQKAGDTDVVRITMKFEKSPLDARLVYNADGKAIRFRITPVEPDASEFPTPAYAADSTRYRESNLVVNERGDWPLPATLTMPVGPGPFPAVVLVHGSGPNDRDETVGRMKPFRDLAWGLATRGVAVLRYEKRTREHGAKLDIPKITLKEETVDDAVAAVALLRRTPGIDAAKVFVLGHSLGGMMAPLIAQGAPNAAGIIIFAGTSRAMEDIILEQVVYIDSLDGEPSAQRKFVHALLKKQIEKVKSPDLKPDTPADELPLKIPATYWLSLRGYEPAAVAAKLPVPILVTQGERDYQVTLAGDFPLWQKALAGNPKATFKTYPALNHCFVAGEGKSRPSEYEKAGNVAEDVVRDIAEWVKKN